MLFFKKYTIVVTTLYKIWTHMRNEDEFNAYLLQIDGINNNCATVVGGIPTADEWTWIDYKNGSKNNKVQFNLPAGIYTLNLIGHEPRVGIDKLIITK